MSNKKKPSAATTSASTASTTRRAPSTRKKRKVMPFDASSDDESKAMIVLADVSSDDENEKKKRVDDDDEFVDDARAEKIVDNGADDDATAPDIDAVPASRPVRRAATASSLKKATKAAAPIVVDFSSVPSSVAMQRAFDLELLDARTSDAYTNALQLLVAEPRDLFALADALSQTKRTARVMLRELVNIECISSSMDEVFAGAVVQISLIGRAALAKRQQLIVARKSIVRAPEVELCGYSSCKTKAFSRLRCSGCHAVTFCNDACLNNSEHILNCLNDTGDPRRQYSDRPTVINLALPIPEPVAPIKVRASRGRGAARGAARARGRGRGRGRGGRGRGGPSASAPSAVTDVAPLTPLAFADVDDVRAAADQRSREEQRAEGAGPSRRNAHHPLRHRP